MNLALDTNAYSDFLRGVPGRVSVVQGADRIYLSLIVLAELRAGFAAGSREPENLATLRKFLTSPRVAVLMPDETTAEHYARVFLQLRKQGTAIPTNDLWIAALALQHDLDLCSSDTHFRHVAGLKLC
jgi:predicted nucleic acid-binding protein